MKMKIISTKNTNLGSRSWAKVERYINYSFDELEVEVKELNKDELVTLFYCALDVIQDMHEGRCETTNVYVKNDTQRM